MAVPYYWIEQIGVERKGWKDRVNGWSRDGDRRKKEKKKRLEKKKCVQREKCRENRVRSRVKKE